MGKTIWQQKCAEKHRPALPIFRHFGLMRWQRGAQQKILCRKPSELRGGVQYLLIRPREKKYLLMYILLWNTINYVAMCLLDQTGRNTQVEQCFCSQDVDKWEGHVHFGLPCLWPCPLWPRITGLLCLDVPSAFILSCLILPKPCPARIAMHNEVHRPVRHKGTSSGRKVPLGAG